MRIRMMLVVCLFSIFGLRTSIAQEINDGARVTITSGATVCLGDEMAVDVNAGGDLDVAGTYDTPVTFSRANAGDRFSIDIDGTSGNRARVDLNYVVIEYLDADGLQIHEGVDVALIQNVSFDHAANSGVYLNLNPSSDPMGSSDDAYIADSLNGVGFSNSDASTGVVNVKAGSDTPAIEMLNWNGSVGGEGNDSETVTDPPGLISWQDQGFHGSDLLLYGSGEAGGTVEIDTDGNGTFDYTVDVDDDGLWFLSLASSGFSVGSNDVTIKVVDSLSAEVDRYDVTLTRSTTADLSDTLYVPANNSSQAICHTVSCGAFSGSPACLQLGSEGTNVHEHGVQLPNMQLIRRFHTMEIDGLHGLTTNMDFHFVLEHRTLTDFDSTVGESWTHNWNTYIEEDSGGDVIIFNSRLTGFAGTKTAMAGDGTHGGDYDLKMGYYGKLTKDTDAHTFTLQLMHGVKWVYYAAPVGVPGRLLYVEDPNGNRIRVTYDFSGRITGFIDTLGHEIAVTYDSNGRIETITDHDGRIWTLVYDGSDDLIEIQSPSITSYEVESEAEIGESASTTASSEVTKFTFDASHHMTAWKQEYDTTLAHDQTIESYVYTSGKIDYITRNGNNIDFDDAPSASPTPLSLLDVGNVRVRITDREGNICDYEFLPSSDGSAPYGVRRKVCWTETGIGNTALRSGEPDYWEQRWVQDCSCLSAPKVSQPWSEDDITAATITFDSDDFPTDYPRTVLEFDSGTATADTMRRLITKYEYLGDTGESIQWKATYETFANFSRRLTWIDPRAFDSNDPINASRTIPSAGAETDFTTTYGYDSWGNHNSTTYPSVTEGQPSTQSISTSSTFNSSGQILTTTDGEANKNTYEYFSTGDGIVGYLKKVTRGATGSSDTAVDLVTENTQMSVLGDVEKYKDPRLNVFEVDRDELRRVTERRTPSITNPSSNITVTSQVYVTQTNYDKAGRAVRTRVKNFDYTGTAGSNAWIDTVRKLDEVGNLLSVRRDVDNTDGNDLTTTFGYDNNDQQNKVVKPEGNQHFTIFDERRLVLKAFQGVESGASLPTNKYDDVLPSSADFVAVVKTKYDARFNVVTTTDGRGNDWDTTFDFRNRKTKQYDALNNYTEYEYSDSGSVLTVESRGDADEFGTSFGSDAYDTATTDTTLLSRTYNRYDRIGRQYQSVMDIDLTDDESASLDPTNTENSSFDTVFDKSSRAAEVVNANGNSTYFTFDAANRKTKREDAFKDTGATYVNTIEWTLDGNGNATVVTFTERPSGGGSAETYYITHTYDQINRNVHSVNEGTTQESDADSVNDKTERFFDSRGNLCCVIDAEAIDGDTDENEGGTDVWTFDDLDRQLTYARFSGIETSTATERVRYSVNAFDDNSLVISIKNYTDVNQTTPTGEQEIQRGYDNLDREVFTVYGDSDETISYSTRPPTITAGGDGNTADYVEKEYDANSNNSKVTDQRDVEIDNTFDKRNFLVNQDFTLPMGGDVIGETFRRYRFDGLGRERICRNDYSMIEKDYDAFSRQTLEVASIDWNGSSTTSVDDYTDDYQTLSIYDKMSNRTEFHADWDGVSDYDMKQTQDFDVLERVKALWIDEEGTETKEALYSYVGPVRLTKKEILQDDSDSAVSVYCDLSYDAKRRRNKVEWKDSDTDTLMVGTEETFDRMDNPLTRGWLHDKVSGTGATRTDYLSYNTRYEAKEVSYSKTSAPGSPDYTLTFDDFYNRKTASLPADLVRSGTAVTWDFENSGSNPVSDKNEYTYFKQGSESAETASSDDAGNMTSAPTGMGAIGCEWGALNLLWATTTVDDEEFDILWNAHNQCIGMIKYLPSPDEGKVDVARRHMYYPNGDHLAFRDADFWYFNEFVEEYLPQEPSADPTEAKDRFFLASDQPQDAAHPTTTYVSTNGTSYNSANDSHSTFLACTSGGGSIERQDDASGNGTMQEYAQPDLQGNQMLFSVDASPLDLSDNSANSTDSGNMYPNSSLGNEFAFHGWYFPQGDFEIGFGLVGRSVYSAPLQRSVSVRPASCRPNVQSFVVSGNSGYECSTTYVKSNLDETIEDFWLFQPPDGEDLSMFDLDGPCEEVTVSFKCREVRYALNPGFDHCYLVFRRPDGKIAGTISAGQWGAMPIRLAYENPTANADFWTEKAGGAGSTEYPLRYKGSSCDFMKCAQNAARNFDKKFEYGAFTTNSNYFVYKVIEKCKGAALFSGTAISSVPDDWEYESVLETTAALAGTPSPYWPAAVLKLGEYTNNPGQLEADQKVVDDAALDRIMRKY